MSETETTCQNVDTEGNCTDNYITLNKLNWHQKVKVSYYLMVVKLMLKTGIHSPYPFHVVFFLLSVFILLKLKKLLFK